MTANLYSIILSLSLSTGRRWYEIYFALNSIIIIFGIWKVSRATISETPTWQSKCTPNYAGSTSEMSRCTPKSPGELALPSPSTETDRTNIMTKARDSLPKVSAGSKRCKKTGRILEMLWMIVEAVVMIVSIKNLFHTCIWYKWGSDLGDSVNKTREVKSVWVGCWERWGATVVGWANLEM